MTRKRPRTISIASSDRARIPFAVVGVLLLITSVTVAVGLQSRDDASTNVDTAMAMDQAAATTQTLLRAATSDATKAAASEPVTVPAETPAGKALESSDEFVFRRYVKLRVYLELQERLQSSTFESSGATTRMSLPRIDYSESSIEDAIDRVSLEVGSDPETSDVDPGTVRATVEGVEYEVTKDGDRVATRTNDVTVSVGTTTFLLHEKVQTYQDRLNNGALDGSGFGRQFAARLYPVMYGKAYYERMAPTSNTPAFKELISKKDTEVLANSAVYAVQRGTFGAEDPAADVLKLRSYSCFGARNLQKILSKRSGSGNPYDRYGIAQRVCQAGKLLTGGPTGSPPGSIQEVVNGMMAGGGSGPGTTGHASDQLTQGREVTIDRFADPAYDEVRGNDIDISEYQSSGAPDDVESSEDVDTDASLPEGDISGDMVPQVIEQIYSVDVDVSTGSASRVSGSYPDPDPPSGSDWSRNGDASRDVVSSDVDVDHTETWRSESGRTRTFHEFTVTVTNDIEDTQSWQRPTDCPRRTVGPCYEYGMTSETSTVTFEVDVTVTATHSDSDGIDVDHLGIENAYQSGGDPSSLSPGNFEETAAKAIEEGINVGAGDPEGNLASAIDGSDVESPGDLQSAIDSQVSGDVTLDSSDFLTGDERSQLKDWLRDELERTHERVKSDPPTGVEPIEISVVEMATGSNVFDPLRDQVTDDQYVTHDVSGRYSSAPRKALAELRTEYVKDVRNWMDRVESARAESTSDANEQMSDEVDGGTDVLNKGIGFAQDALSGSISEPDADIEDPPLLGDVSYSVDASPSYLTLNPITRQTSSAVRPEHRSVTEVEDSDHAPMAVRKENTFGHPGMPLIPWPTYWYLSVDHWDVEVNGEYARFQVTASHDDPSGTKTTTYVRQAMPVELEIAGQQRTVGEVEPIEFSSSTNVVVAVPGGTVYPKPAYGVGDRWHGSGKPYKSTCSSTWPHVGPDFAPSDVAYDQCNNLQQQGSSTLQQYLPGSDTIESIPLEVDSDGDVDVEEGEPGEFNDECDADYLEERLDSTGADRFEDYREQAREDVADTYCSLIRPEYRGMYEYLLGYDEESVTDDWVSMSRADRMDDNRIKDTLKYLTWDADGDGQPLGKDQEIKWFRSAHRENQGARVRPGDLPPHREPGIVTKVVTTDELELARIYGNGEEDGNIYGGYLARPKDVRYRSEKTLIQDFALLDTALITPHGSDDYPWADYECLGKTYVPKDFPMKISYTSRITADDIADASDPAEPDRSSSMWSENEAVEGGAIQFELGDRISDSERWVPLGSIYELNVDTSGETFESKWRSSNSGDSDPVGEACS